MGTPGGNSACVLLSTSCSSSYSTSFTLTFLPAYHNAFSRAATNKGRSSGALASSSANPATFNKRSMRMWRVCDSASAAAARGLAFAKPGMSSMPAAHFSLSRAAALAGVLLCCIKTDQNFRLPRHLTESNI
jgi:hypothetical protein